MSGLVNSYNCTQTYSLNENGYATSCISEYSYETGWNQTKNTTFKYSNDGYLLSYDLVEDNDKYSCEFKYENNNMTSIIEKYNNDIALIWIDAHPDITLPEDNTYAGYHAMAVSACMGNVDKYISSILPSKISADRILFVGLRDWERDEIKKRQEEYGITHFAPEEASSENIINWLKNLNVSKVLIHFDLDVLDPNEIIAAVGVSPNGMKINETVKIINDIAKEKEIVGFTIAEHMPRIEIMLKNMMADLSLFN